MADPLLSIQDASKHYQTGKGWLGKGGGLVRAVRHVSLDILPGESLGLVGESGCGKSTLGRLAVGLEPPTSGQLRFQGSVLPAKPPKSFHRQVQMIFQDPYSSLNPRHPIGSIVREPLDIHGLGSRAQRKEKALELLRLVGVRPEHASRFPHQFSGGQRQRVAIARALALEPALVVCDEPVSALDVSIQAQVLRLLGDMRERFGLAYLFISHDLSVVGAVCQRVAVMYLGRLVEIAPRADLFNSPLHPYTRVLMAAMPKPDPDAPRQRESLQGEPPSPLDPRPAAPSTPAAPTPPNPATRSSPPGPNPGPDTGWPAICIEEGRGKRKISPSATRTCSALDPRQTQFACVVAGQGGGCSREGSTPANPPLQGFQSR